MKQEFFTAFDNSKLALYVWDSVTHPRGVVLLAHGMMEHAQRYTHFAEFLNANGFIVIAPDLRAFGKTAASLAENGIYEGDYFGDSVRDFCDLHKFSRQRFPDLPVFMLGHSAGSYIGQRMAQQDRVRLKGLILMGTSYMKSPIYGAAQRLVNQMTNSKGFQQPAKWLDSLIFGTYDKKFKGEGRSAWLSRDKAEVERYRNDPYCGVVSSYGFYRSLLNFNEMYENESLARIPRDLPILILAGGEDQINGGTGAGARKLHSMYQTLGLTDVQLRIYAGARHELINELNKEEVYGDILKFLERHLDEGSTP